MQSCDGLKLAPSLFDTSARSKYEKQFEGNDSLMQNWKNNYISAQKSVLQIENSYAAVVSKSSGLNALSYLISLKNGDRLIIETPETNFKIFADVYEQKFENEKSESILLEDGKLSKNIEKDAVYRIIVQPEIGFSEQFNIKIYTQSAYIFPVAGKGNKDAQSFWGASRDGGSRSHEGVDIFASRGTPVIAATDGFISKTGNTGLGGKQVWLRDGLFGKSLYYAHLDSIIAVTGQKVNVGDTLGLVGNTGNAKGGATHLHFGIYTSGGAVDAYPFIRQRPVPKEAISNSATYNMIKAGSNLRLGPGTDYEIINTLTVDTSISVLAVNGEWLHIKTKGNLEGFINVSRLK